MLLKSSFTCVHYAVLLCQNSIFITPSIKCTLVLALESKWGELELTRATAFILEKITILAACLASTRATIVLVENILTKATLTLINGASYIVIAVLVFGAWQG